MTMTSKTYVKDQATAEVDMSAHAVTVRLKRVSQLRRLCLSLAKAEVMQKPTKPFETPTDPQKDDQSES